MSRVPKQVHEIAIEMRKESPPSSIEVEVPENFDIMIGTLKIQIQVN